MWSDFRKIYNKLQDDESKFIFRKRLEYNLCHENTESLFEMVTYREDNKEQNMYTLLKNRDCYSIERPIIIFGAGYYGQIIKPFIEAYKIGTLVAYCDNNKELQGTKYENIPIWSVEEVCKSETTALFLISSYSSFQDMKEQLISLGIKEENIFYGCSILSIYGKQYFDKDIIREHSENEIFIDGGSFDLMDTCHFIEMYPNFKKVYAFEPEASNYELCERNRENILENNDKIEIINKGLWSREAKLGLAGGGTESFISEHGEKSVDVTSIDSCLNGKNEKVSFIKLDIEGAELEALKGARETIIRDKPDLAICIYHKDEDIVEIPKYILELNPDYELYIRHYSWAAWETVLYAVNARMNPYELSDLKWKMLTKILDEPDNIMKAVAAIDNLVIYGMGNLTKALVREMKARDISPLCIIDANKDSGYFEEIPVYNIEEVHGLENKEISILVTPVNNMHAVRSKLSDYKISGKLIPIWEIISDDGLAERLKYINRL